jgi:hypothetical protein
MRYLCLSLALAALIVPTTLKADTLYSADFSGGIQYPSVGSPFDGLCSAGDICGGVTGSFVFDSNQIPASNSGFVNVFLSGIPGSGSIPSSTAFNISLGPNLSFTLADAAQGSGAIQYNNGNFNGFFYLADFTYQGNNYQLDDQGGLFSIYLLNSLGEETTVEASGYLNFNLTNETPYQISTPPPPPSSVPEPSSLALLCSGLLGLAGTVRRKFSSR